VFRRPVHIIGDYQVEIAVLVIVKPGATGCPFPHVGNAGSFCYVSERAVAVVVKEDGTSVPRNIQIRGAVVVIIARGYPHAEKTRGPHLRLFGYIGEGSVSVIAVERAAQGPTGSVDFCGGAIDQENVRPSIIVIIDPSASRAHRLNEVLLRRCRVIVDERDSGRFRYIGKSNRSIGRVTRCRWIGLKETEEGGCAHCKPSKNRAEV